MKTPFMYDKCFENDSLLFTLAHLPRLQIGVRLLPFYWYWVPLMAEQLVPIIKSDEV